MFIIWKNRTPVSAVVAKKEVAEQFKDLAAPEVYVIGDCVEARKIYHAFEDAWRAAS